MLARLAPGILGAACLLAAPSRLPAGKAVYSVEKAQALSSRTGRPILAIAGTTG